MDRVLSGCWISTLKEIRDLKERINEPVESILLEEGERIKYGEVG